MRSYVGKRFARLVRVDGGERFIAVSLLVGLNADLELVGLGDNKFVEGIEPRLLLGIVPCQPAEVIELGRGGFHRSVERLEILGIGTQQGGAEGALGIAHGDQESLGAALDLQGMEHPLVGVP